MKSYYNKKENVLPALVMNLSVCLAVVCTTTDNIKYLFWFFTIFHIVTVFIMYSPIFNKEK